MKIKIARGLLYSGVIGLAVICIIAMADNYQLAITKGISSTISCYNTESFDVDLGQVKPIEQCDQYNPQLVFFGSIALLIIDVVMFYIFNKVLGQNPNIGRAFQKELEDWKKNQDPKQEENKKRLFTI